MIYFPPIEKANEEGLVAIGGKLNTDWILEAYSRGIFPWFNENSPILWWSPDPRAVMKPSDVKISKSMKVVFNKSIFQLKIDTAFEQVITHCKTIERKYQDGTWITDKMLENFIKLHQLGYAHSFETWKNNKLVGGLYGLSLGRAFFGESMFSLEANSSKFAFISLNKILKKKNFIFIDCQIPNSHLNSLGCKLMPRNKFASLLQKSNQHKTIIGSWTKNLII